MGNARWNGNHSRLFPNDVDDHIAAKTRLPAPHIFQTDRRMTGQNDNVIPTQAMDVNTAQYAAMGEYQIPLHRPRRQAPFIAMNFTQAAPHIVGGVDGAHRNTDNIGRFRWMNVKSLH